MKNSNNRISTKIKILGAGLIFTILSLIVLTIYLNQKNIKDSLIINIAGKERMLTQKISKNIFYLYNQRELDFNELDNAVEEFKHILDSLKNGDELRGISPVPTDEIALQISKVIVLWNSFNTNVQTFKELIITKNDKIIFKNSSQDINFLNIFFQPIISKETIDTLSQENIY